MTLVERLDAFEERLSSQLQLDREAIVRSISQEFIARAITPSGAATPLSSGGGLAPIVFLPPEDEDVQCGSCGRSFPAWRAAIHSSACARLAQRPSPGVKAAQSQADAIRERAQRRLEAAGMGRAEGASAPRGGVVVGLGSSGPKRVTPVGMGGSRHPPRPPQPRGAPRSEALVGAFAPAASDDAPAAVRAAAPAAKAAAPAARAAAPAARESWNECEVCAPAEEPEPPAAQRVPSGTSDSREEEQAGGFRGGGGFGGSGFGGGGGMEEIAEFADVSGELVPCPNCSRNFLESRLEKHMKICSKQKVRKTFGPDAERMKLKEEAPQDHTKAQKKSTWKQQHAAFIQAMSSVKKGEGAEVDMPVPEDTRVECPHCGRKFAEETATRHIPHCHEAQLKKASRGNGPTPKGGESPGPGQRRPVAKKGR